MIICLATKEHGSSVGRFLRDWGRELDGELCAARYDRLVRLDDGALASGRLAGLFGARGLLRGPRTPSAGGWTLVFSDLERVPSPEIERLGEVWDALARSSRIRGLLNDPRRVKTRLELLRSLKREGLNDFAVHLIRDGRVPRLERYPVFVREANDHRGPLTDLIHTQEELHARVAALFAAGRLRSAPIVTEFIDTSDATGFYCKFGAFRIGNAIVPAHVQSGKHWVVKNGSSAPSRELVEREWNYVRENPHRRRLMEIFERAGIDYGRIDYALADGRIQVFEINTNPTLLKPGSSRNADRNQRKQYVAKELIRAFRALEGCS